MSRTRSASSSAMARGRVPSHTASGCGMNLQHSLLPDCEAGDHDFDEANRPRATTTTLRSILIDRPVVQHIPRAILLLGLPFRFRFLTLFFRLTCLCSILLCG